MIAYKNVTNITTESMGNNGQLPFLALDVHRNSFNADSFEEHWPPSLDTRRPSTNTITLPKLTENIAEEGSISNM